MASVLEFNKKHAFTLVEILIAIVIITILAAILLSALKEAREKAKRVVCINNLRQIGQGLRMYGNDWGFLPKAGGVYLWNDHPDSSSRGATGIGILKSTGYMEDLKVAYCPSNNVYTQDFISSNPTYGGLQYYGVPEKVSICNYYYYVNMLPNEGDPATIIISGDGFYPIDNDITSRRPLVLDRQLPNSYYNGKQCVTHNFAGFNTLWGDGHVSWETYTKYFSQYSHEGTAIVKTIDYLCRRDGALPFFSEDWPGY